MEKKSKQKRSAQLKKVSTTRKPKTQAVKNATTPQSALQRLLAIQPDILAIGPEKNLDEVLTSIAETANSLLGGNFCIVFPYDHASDRFLLNEVKSGGIPTARTFTWGEPRPEGASRTTLRDGEMIIEDHGDPKYVKKYPFLRERVADGQRFGAYEDVALVKATLGERLQAGEEYFGVLVVNYPEPHKFQQPEIDIAKVFASQAAIAIRNAKLYRQYRALVDSAESFSALRSTTNTKDTLEKIIQVVHKVLSSDLTVIFPYNQKKDIFLMENLVAIGEGVEGYKFSVPREEGCTRKVLREKSIVHYNLGEAPPEWKDLLGSGIFKQHFEIQAIVAVPLKVSKEPLGVLYINYNYRHRFDKAELDLIEAFANQVALLLYNTTVLESEQKERRLAETLRDTSADLLQIPNLQMALERTLEQVKKVIPYDAALLMLMEGPRLISRAAIGFEYQDKVLKFSLDPTEDIIFKEHGNITRPLYLFDVKNDARWKPVPTVDWVRGWLGVRLYSKDGEIIGEIGLYSRDEGFYNQEDADTLSAFANQAVWAIENARYLEQINKMNEIQKQILSQSADLDRVIHIILNEGLNLVGANIGQVLLLDEDKKNLIISASTSEVDEGRYLDIRDSITGQVIIQNQPLLISDLTVEPSKSLYKAPEGAVGGSELAVPLLIGEEVIGVLNVESPNKGAFSENQKGLLSNLANFAASAIQAAKSTVLELDIFEGTQEIILSETFELEEVYDLISKYAKEITKADLGEVWLANKDGERLERVSVVPEPINEEVKKYLRINECVNGKAILRKSPILIKETQEEEVYVANPFGLMHSELVVPLLVKGRAIGTVNIESYEKNAFTHHHQILLQTLADQAVIAIQFARRRQEQRTIAEIEEELLSAAFDQGQVLDLILKRGLELIDATLGQVLTVDGNKLVIRTSTYGPDKGNSVDIEDSVTGVAVKERRPILVNNVQTDKAYEKLYKPILGLDLHSELVVPLISGDDVIGALNIEDERIGAFSEEDQNLLKALAREAALTLRLAEAFTVTEIFRDVQDGILSERYNLEEASAEILKQAQLLTGAETGQILLLENEDTLVIKASTNLDEVNVTKVKVDDSISGIAIEENRVVNVRDVKTEEPYKFRYKQFLGGNIHSELVVPLRVSKNIIGVLNVESPRIGAFVQRHVNILSTLAGQAAMAFRTADEIISRSRTLELAARTADAEKRASEADKMAAAGQIIHRLKGRSGAIRGWVDIIKDQQTKLLAEDDTFKKAINDIYHKAGEITELVLDFQSQASDPYALMEIAPLIKMAVEKSKTTEEYIFTKGNLEFQENIDNNLPKIRTHPVLSDVFLNILNNAVRVMPNGGEIDIAAKVDGPWIKVTITDNGPGIPSEIQPLIFDPKFTGSQEGVHGLGLWWTRAFVRSINGEILVESVLGKGACFIIKLPIPTEQE